MSKISVFVSGIPVPQGSMRGFVRNGRAVITSDNGKLRSWRQEVSDALHTAVAAQGGFAGPVECRLEFTFLRPASHYGSRGLRPSAPQVPDRKPDLDKTIRACLDAGTVARVWEDDSRVVTIRATKRYAADGAEPGVWITIVPFNWSDRSEAAA